MSTTEGELPIQEGESRNPFVAESSNMPQSLLIGNLERAYLARLKSLGYSSEYDGEFSVVRITNKRGKQVAHVTNHGVNEFISIEHGNVKLAEELQAMTPDDVLYERVDTMVGDSLFVFYPDVTNEELGILRTQIEPIDGKIIVTQGEYAVVGPNDPNETVATFGLETCRGVLIFDKKTGMCALGHTDGAELYDEGMIQAMRRDLIQLGARPKDLVLYGTPNIDHYKKQELKKIYREAHFDRGSSLSFNTRTKQVTDFFDATSFPRTENFNFRMGRRDEVRMAHRVPFVRAY